MSMQERAVAEALRQYFDPSDGRLAERLDAAVGDRGLLASVLDRYVGPTSVLAETLTRHLGAESAIFKRLSPTDGEGLVKIVETKVAEVLARHQAELNRALDPLAADGAIARFFGELRSELTAAGSGQADQLRVALAALDANNEHSAISRLMRETSQARRDLLGALNPRDPASPLAAIEATVRALIDGQSKGLTSFQEEMRQRHDSLGTEVREALARIETRRRMDARTPDGGRVFEAALAAFISERLRNAPIVIEETGNSVGLRPRCKVGDLVLRHTGEGAFAGAALVIEGKHDRSYSVATALAELTEARENRGASAGLLVMATSHASPGFPRLARHGQDVLVCWDPDDPASDAWLEAGLTLGLYLVSRTRAADDGDLRAMVDVEHRIDVELSRITTLEKHNKKVEEGCDAIAAELRKAKKELRVLLDKAKSTLRSLDVALDEAAERECPLDVRMSDSGDLLQ